MRVFGPPREKYQWILWLTPWVWNFGFWRLDPEKTDMALVFRWIVQIGPLEVRRWTDTARRMV